MRAGLVAQPQDWPWSSYRAHVGQAEGPAWLGSAELHGYLVGRDAQTAADRAKAARAYAKWVAVRAPCDGVVEALLCAPGDQVVEGGELLRLGDAPDQAAFVQP